MNYRLIELKKKLRHLKAIGNSCFYDTTKQYIPVDIENSTKPLINTLKENSKGYSRIKTYNKRLYSKKEVD